MGVMTCSRKDCQNIMCDTYVDFVGYVCLDCQSEFKDFLQSQSKDGLTEGDILRELKAFITTPKGEHMGEKMSVEQFFKIRTR